MHPINNSPQPIPHDFASFRSKEERATSHQVKRIDRRVKKRKYIPRPTLRKVPNEKDDASGRENGKFMGFMCPRGPALDHPFAETLLSYAENGCRVDCGDNWSKQQIEEAVRRGPHKSAREAEAAAYA